MSLKIRLSRWGAKKRPVYRIVVADGRRPRDGRFIENLGTFDPLKAKDDATRLTLNGEKAQAWITKGAQPTDRVLKLLASIGVGEAPVRNTRRRPAEEEGAGARGRGREARRRRACRVRPGRSVGDADGPPDGTLPGVVIDLPMTIQTVEDRYEPGISLDDRAARAARDRGLPEPR